MSYMAAHWSLPQEFNTLFQTCSSNIQKISQNTGQITSLLHQLGLSQDTSQLQERLLQLQHCTNQLAKDTNRSLKELSCLPASQQRQQKLQKERLMSDFSAALSSFQAVQRTAAEKQKQLVARARAGSKRDGGARLEALETEDDRAQVQTQESATIAEEDLHAIRERETSIRQLEADITDVNQIFKDLAVMIHDQGEMIDSIEANVDTAAGHVDGGAAQLQKAAYYQRKSRKRMCLLSMAASLVLVILILIIWQAIQ